MGGNGSPFLACCQQHVMPDHSRPIAKSAPSQAEAHCLQAGFSAYLEAFEKQLLASRRKAAIDRRQHHANLILRDIKAPGPEPVETLSLRAAATVQSHDDLQSVMLSELQHFDPAIGLYRRM